MQTAKRNLTFYKTMPEWDVFLTRSQSYISCFVHPLTLWKDKYIPTKCVFLRTWWEAGWHRFPCAEPSYYSGFLCFSNFVMARLSDSTSWLESVSEYTLLCLFLQSWISSLFSCVLFWSWIPGMAQLCGSLYLP